MDDLDKNEKNRKDINLYCIIKMRVITYTQQNGHALNTQITNIWHANRRDLKTDADNMQENEQSVCTETNHILWTEWTELAGNFFRGGNYDRSIAAEFNRNTEKTASADYDIRSFRDLFYRISPCMVYLPALCDGAGRLESGTGIHVLLSGTEHFCIRKYRRRKDAEPL